jgi:DNA-binding NtrC family response regulator
MHARQGAVAVPPPTWHEAVATFKRELIARALRQSCGNRTRDARTLGLQRTYLLRLMREMGVTAPRAVLGGRCPTASDVQK